MYSLLWLQFNQFNKYSGNKNVFIITYKNITKALFLKVYLPTLEKLYAQRQRVQDTLEEKFGAIGCESGNVQVQWNNIMECVLDTISDLVGEVEKRARKPWITQEMISKMDERRKWKNINTEEGRKNYWRLRCFERYYRSSSEASKL